MKKYGLFFPGGTDPSQTFEGDSMAQNGDYVFVWRKVQGHPGHGEQVAAIKLGDGQCVKEIK